MEENSIYTVVSNGMEWSKMSEIRALFLLSSWYQTITNTELIVVENIGGLGFTNATVVEELVPAFIGDMKDWIYGIL